MTHQSTLELKNYLMNSSDEIIYNIAQILGDRLGFNSMRKRVSSVGDVPKNQKQKEGLVDDMLKEIGYFGSNNFAYWGRWVSGTNRAVGYHEIVYDVVKLLNKQLKKNWTFHDLQQSCRVCTLFCTPNTPTLNASWLRIKIVSKKPRD